MGTISIEQIIITPLVRIPVVGGDVLHALKKSDRTFSDFGEAYFSIAKYRAVKAWKRHTEMILNLIVPIGNVRFVFLDEDMKQRELIIGESNYVRLTVPPGIWFGFQGMSKRDSLLLNIASIEHDPQETERRDINTINFNWEIK